MITGFNTDVEFEGTTYHVQTEDKGLATPLILSLVYNGGTILASRRTPYEDLINGELDEKGLSARLNKQHRTICAAIKAGRLNDLITATRLDRDRKNEVLAEIPAPEEPVEAVAPSGAMAGRIDSVPPIPMPASGGDTQEAAPDEFAILDEEIIVPAEAVEIVSEMEGRERPSNSRLTLELLGESRFKGGEHKSVNFMVCRGSDRKVVSGAQIMVKILGSGFRPQIFHAKTDTNGIARVNLQFPTFSDGRAALLIRAMNDGEEVELRRIVSSR